MSLLKILMPARTVLMLSSSIRCSSTKAMKELAKFISCCFWWEGMSYMKRSMSSTARSLNFQSECDSMCWIKVRGSAPKATAVLGGCKTTGSKFRWAKDWAAYS